MSERVVHSGRISRIVEVTFSDGSCGYDVVIGDYHVPENQSRLAVATLTNGIELCEKIDDVVLD